MKKNEIVSDILAVAGAVGVCIGIGLIYLPAGIIAAGAALIALGWAISGHSE